MMLDELAHLVRQAGGQQLVGYRPGVYGHIATYDAATHKVRCIIPSLRDADNAPVITPWLNLGSMWVGAGWGMQFAPLGGASVGNPTAGEQVQIVLADRERGVMAVPALYFTDAMLPPGGLSAGEAVLRHRTGTFLKFHASGDVEANAQGNVVVTATGNATVTAGGTAAVVAPAVKLCKVLADALQSLCTAAFATWAEGHVHADPQGGTTGVPTTAPPANALTSVLTAE